jgi:hypothetical protein
MFKILFKKRLTVMLARGKNFWFLKENHAVQGEKTSDS